METEGFRVLLPGCVGQLTPPSSTLFIGEDESVLHCLKRGQKISYCKLKERLRARASGLGRKRNGKSGALGAGGGCILTGRVVGDGWE